VAFDRPDSDALASDVTRRLRVRGLRGLLLSAQLLKESTNKLIHL
jgi:hypothetical protein